MFMSLKQEGLQLNSLVYCYLKVITCVLPRIIPFSLLAMQNKQSLQLNITEYSVVYFYGRVLKRAYQVNNKAHCHEKEEAMKFYI